MKRISINQKITAFDSEAFKMYLNEVSKMPILTPHEELKYAERAVNGDKKAEELLISCNLRFVISVAKLYVDDYCRLEDLVNEGNEGLITAARRFDPSTGYKFISYAVWWIRHNIMIYKSNYGRLIRIPNNKIVESNKVRKETNKFEEKFNREPSSEELNDLLKGDITAERMRQIYEINNTNVKSLDMAIDVDGSTFKDLLPDTGCNPTDYILINEDETYKFSTMLSVLSPEQEKVIRLIYGLNGDKPMTLAEVGVEIGKSRERVRQLKDKALEILQKSAKRNHWIRHFEG
jgi:RNA polymerase primary sigma factor